MGVKTGKVLIHIFIQHTLMEHLFYASYHREQDRPSPAPPKESEQIICNCNNLMEKKNRILRWRIMMEGSGED